MKKQTKTANIKKDKEFLSQIPDWERNYIETEEAKIIDFKKEDWPKAKATFTDHDLKIFDCAVMEDWETPYMKDLADIATMKGGVILELGYGMGISANFIQTHKITKHIIIEANHQVAQRARLFAKHAKYETEILEGFWEDQIKKIPDESIDGILFDTYPLSEPELYQNHFYFFPYAFRKLKPGGVFTYYSDEIKGFGKVHLKKLKEAGFKLKNIKYKISKVKPPKDCEYWKANTILAPIILK
jgi:guanidinoacetate N-methyltransferase